MIKTIPPAVAICVMLYFLPEHYQNQWLAVALAATFISFFVWWEMFRLPMALLCTYLIGAAFFNGSIYTHFVMNIYMSSILVSLRHTLFWLLLIVVIYRLRIKPETIAKALSVPWVALTFLGFPPLWNYSCNAAMAVAFIPFQPKLWMMLLCVTPALFQMGTTPLFMLGVLLAYHTLKNRLIWPYAGLPPFLWWAYTHPWRFDEHERWAFYARSVRFFWEYCNLWIGTGIGSFPVFGPIVQAVNGDQSAYWLSAHSDLVQWLFEMGVLGAVLGIWVIIDCLAVMGTRERMALCAMLAFATFYFPLEIPACLIWCLCLVVTASRRIPLY